MAVLYRLFLQILLHLERIRRVLVGGCGFGVLFTDHNQAVLSTAIFDIVRVHIIDKSFRQVVHFVDLFRVVPRGERLQTEALVGDLGSLLTISVDVLLVRPLIARPSGVILAAALIVHQSSGKTASGCCCGALGVWNDATAPLICPSGHTWPVRNLRLLIIHL